MPSRPLSAPCAISGHLLDQIGVKWTGLYRANCAKVACMSTRYVSGPHLARLLGDVSAERPVYAALARSVRGLVLDGRLALRTRLPAERDLAAALGVSRTTVTTAYDRLREEGYIESRQGAGSWTALPPVRMSSAERRTAPPGGRFGKAYPAPDDASFIDLGCATPQPRRSSRRPSPPPSTSCPATAPGPATGRPGWRACGRSSRTGTRRAASRPAPTRSSSRPARSTRSRC